MEINAFPNRCCDQSERAAAVPQRFSPPRDSMDPHCCLRFLVYRADIAPPASTRCRNQSARTRPLGSARKETRSHYRDTRARTSLTAGGTDDLLNHEKAYKAKHRFE